MFRFPGKVLAAVDVWGGAPGTVNTDARRLGDAKPFVDAIVRIHRRYGYFRRAPRSSLATVCVLVLPPLARPMVKDPPSRSKLSQRNPTASDARKPWPGAVGACHARDSDHACQQPRSV
jgi:hypothetical protein